MTHEHRILIVSDPELSRSLEVPFRRAGWSVFRSPDLKSLNMHLSSVRPQAVLIGLDARWFDMSALDYLVSASESNIPVIALTALTPSPIDGPVIFLPANTPIEDIIQHVEHVSAQTRPAAIS